MGRMGRMGPIEAESESRVVGKLRATSCELRARREEEEERASDGTLFALLTRHASRVTARGKACEPGEPGWGRCPLRRAPQSP